MEKQAVATIGFTQSTAEHFFGRLRDAGVRTVLDVRLHNTSQLAGFAKADDLGFFLKKICGIEYRHEPLLAPTDEMLKAYKRDKGDWGNYRDGFLSLLAARKIEERLAPEMFGETCLLCSEATPDKCHRRLVCEYLNGKWGGCLNVKHL